MLSKSIWQPLIGWVQRGSERGSSLDNALVRKEKRVDVCLCVCICLQIWNGALHFSVNRVIVTKQGFLCVLKISLIQLHIYIYIYILDFLDYHWYQNNKLKHHEHRNPSKMCSESSLCLRMTVLLNSAKTSSIKHFFFLQLVAVGLNNM